MSDVGKRERIALPQQTGVRRDWRRRLVPTAALVLLAVSIGFSVYARKRIARAERRASHYSMLRESLAPLEASWQRYQAGLAFIQTRQAAAGADPTESWASLPMPRPDSTSTNRMTIAETWDLLQMEMAWAETDYSMLPGLLRSALEATPPSFAASIWMEPSGMGKGRLTLRLDMPVLRHANEKPLMNTTEHE